MIYEDKCFGCPMRQKYIDPEIERARDFWHKNSKPYVFECGAVYNPELLNNKNFTSFSGKDKGVEIAPLRCKKDH